ncbi:MAG TPA: peptide chain release factor 1 [Lentisphaeria bacterium]|nr:peptide chain release factor 1 [Lentisphaeria bacterium]
MDLDNYIANSTSRLGEVERAISSFDFEKDGQDRYQALNREYQRLKQLVDCWAELAKIRSDLAGNEELLATTTDAELRQLVETDLADLQQRERLLDCQLKAFILPPHPNEGKNTIIEIRPAAGGDEAGLFAADLHRMYIRYAEQKGWKVNLLEYQDTPLGGLKSASFTLLGDGAWSMMRFESGVHRVQRIPTTEAQGRIHTSTVTVAVLAEAEEVDVQLNPEDLRIDVFRSSGHGGQSVNTTDSAVRVTHLPTGLSIASQQEKSQHRNKEIAMTLLRARLLEIKQRAEDEKNSSERRSQVGAGDRSERIRTYNYPQNRVTDHRFELTFYDLTNIMEGNLDELLNGIRALDAIHRLETELLA